MVGEPLSGGVRFVEEALRRCEMQQMPRIQMAASTAAPPTLTAIICQIGQGFEDEVAAVPATEEEASTEGGSSTTALTG
jgi:hypothetical protein